MIRDFFRLFAKFLKTTATPKMITRFLAIGTREFTDRQIQEQRRKHLARFRRQNYFFQFLVNYLGYQEGQQILEGVEDFGYSQIHSIHIDHGEDGFSDIETVVSDGSFDHHHMDFWEGDNEFVQMNTSFTESI